MNKGLTLDLNIPNGKIPNNGGKSESSHHMRSARSTPNLKGSTPIQNLTHPPRKERTHRKGTLRSSASVSALSSRQEFKDGFANFHIKTCFNLNFFFLTSNLDM